MQTLFEKLVNKSSTSRLSYVQQMFISSVTRSIFLSMRTRNISKADLARRLGKSKSHLTQMLAGGRNMTLRTLAEIADSMDYVVRVEFFEKAAEESSWTDIGRFRTKELLAPLIASNDCWIDVKASNYDGRTEAEAA